MFFFLFTVLVRANCKTSLWIMHVSKLLLLTQNAFYFLTKKKTCTRCVFLFSILCKLSDHNGDHYYQLNILFITKCLLYRAMIMFPTSNVCTTRFYFSKKKKIIFIKRALYLFYPAPLRCLYTAELCGDSVPTSSNIACVRLKKTKNHFNLLVRCGFSRFCCAVRLTINKFIWAVANIWTLNSTTESTYNTIFDLMAYFFFASDLPCLLWSWGICFVPWSQYSWDSNI